MLRVWFLPIVDACSTLGWFWVYPTFISVFWYWLPVVHCYTILIVFVYCFVVQLLFLVGNMCLLHFAKHGCCSKSHVSLNRLCSITPRPVTRGVQGGKCPLRKISAPPWKNVLDKVSEIWAPLRKLFFLPHPGKMCWTKFQKFGPLSENSSLPLVSQAGDGPDYTWAQFDQGFEILVYVGL